MWVTPFFFPAVDIVVLQTRFTVEEIGAATSLFNHCEYSIIHSVEARNRK